MVHIVSDDETALHKFCFRFKFCMWPGWVVWAAFMHVFLVFGAPFEPRPPLVATLSTHTVDQNPSNALSLVCIGPICLRFDPI